MIKEIIRQANFVENNDKSLEDEFLKLIDKVTLLKDTQYFDNDNSRENHSRLILIKLIYFINQGQKINTLDTELLFFRIIKLFKFDSPNLRRIVYMILKMIIDQKFEFMLISCLKKDITNRNIYIRQNALKMVPYLTDIQNIIEFEKFIQMDLMNQCKQIQSTALLSALQIYLKFPHILSSWSQEIKNALQEQNIHALILIYKVLYQDKNILLKTLIQMIQNKYQPLFIINVVKFIKEILFFHKQLPDLQFHKSDLMGYLLLQLSSDEDLVFFETVKIMMRRINSLPKRLLRLIASLLCHYLRPLADSITTYTAIMVLKNVSKLNNLNQLVNNIIFEKLEYLIYSPHAGISANSLFVCMKIKNQFNQKFLRNLFIKTNNLDEKNNFIQGLIEFSDMFHILGDEILKFLEKIITKDSSDDLVLQAFKIIKYILKDANQQFYYKSINTLFSITALCNIKHKFKVVKLVLKEFGLIPDKEINQSCLNNQFSYLKDFFSGFNAKQNNYPKFLITELIISKFEGKKTLNKKFYEKDIFDEHYQQEKIQLLAQNIQQD